MLNWRGSIGVGGGALVALVLANGCGAPTANELTGGANDSRVVSAGSGEEDDPESPSTTPSTPSSPSPPPPTGNSSGGMPKPDGVPSPGKVACGAASCNTATEACCSGGLSPASCLPTKQPCPNGGGKLSCDDTADCPAGQKCCAGMFGGACAASCGFGTPVQLCATHAECGTAGECTEKTCSSIAGTYTIRSCGAAPIGCK